ncbi:methionine ABC transporter substrate-binding protein [Ignatzschineria indica]|uniref:ABC transporter substrate-binding protein n=1 Tax=Ignatzschineria indica TaxID=472583 RepID=A0A2U2AP79_9GAMM|nr:MULTISPECIES: MetQ/NlpA family ABC transporter substrate-binding protein [Ignatzschineria]MDM1545153.1 MetQ/NlpA family ABC transporter substrate-binding protein [Ignatzschineria indica]OYQ81229.1 methionine ABC transporter substrate-binding protein [Ignatzschineria sp. F8392]PWD84948.1 ABC transporter substrate-binding protein [Ignatzschineria indica]GGZ80322.1 methionine ABC transporter substrate-binding protein [Ignatzschineria indica]
MRKLALVTALSLTPFIGFSAEKLKVVATPVPHAEILEFIEPQLAKKEIDLDIVVVTDYVLPNLMVDEKEADANFFQHFPYLEEFNKNHQLNIIALDPAIHVEPIAAYSQKIKEKGDLKEGAKVSIPNDPANGGRALLLLHNEGIITLTNPDNILSTVFDIKENPHKLQFVELEAPMLARTLDEVDLALINTNFALEAGLNPIKDSLFIEGAESPYANIIAILPENSDDPRIKALIEVITTDEVRDFINEKYQGSIVPAF